MATNNNFNFDAFNANMKGVGIGLKLHLAVQMIKDVVDGLERFDNPLESELRPVYVDLKAVHSMYKDAAKARAAKSANESERTSSIDNSTKPTLGISDMMAMFAEFQKMQAAQNQGTAIPGAAAESIKQIQDGVLHQQGEKAAA